ncbi:ArnT family glycosyltransferase [Nocardia sp. CDC160]|uniref:ArnT family glycosyltransferase n=1 Tax=Nocardia sp. CDC160 TaxID=3112166 RepID=UPI002DB5F69E|nr:glycosyltransferase family 39 protein [Nocardia sp. CDC160]MEC3919162.1 glycosyltransferase family 39 protein [Nocardia sp. CDC160]
MNISMYSRSASTTVPAFAWPAVLGLAGVVVVVQSMAGLRGGYWFDEAYMVAVGRDHLAWGSADQPPMAPALAAAAEWMAPGSLSLLRIPAVLATAGAVIVVALIAREFGGDRRAQVIAAGAQATALWVTFCGHWLTPYTLEPVQWVVLIWLLVRWIRIRDDRLLLGLGAVAGIALETKFQVLLLGAVLFVAVAICGPRELLRRPMLWAGTGLALLIGLPTLLWQAAHDWPQLRMGSVVASEADALYGGRVGVAVLLIVAAGVAGTVLALYGLWLLLRAPDLRCYRFLGVTVVALYVFFVVTAGRPYYLGGLYGVLFAAGAVGFQQRRLIKLRRTWLIWPAYVVSIVAAAALLAVSARSTDSAAAHAITDRTVNAYNTLSAADRSSTIIMGQSYIVAAYIDVYTDLPPVYSTNRSYGYFAPPPDSARDVLYVGADTDELNPYFNECRKVIQAGDNEQQVFLCTGRQQSWQELWPRLRHLNVG